MKFCTKKFGERLQQLRKVHSMDHAEFASILDTTIRDIEQIEQGLHAPDSDLILNLYVNFKEDFHFLVTGQHDPASES